MIAVLRFLLFFGFRMYGRVWVIEFCRTLVILTRYKENAFIHSQTIHERIHQYIRRFA